MVEKEIGKTYNEKMLEIKDIEDNDTFKNARMTSLNNQRLEDLESLECIKKNEKCSRSKKAINNIETRLEKANKNRYLK